MSVCQKLVPLDVLVCSEDLVDRSSSNNREFKSSNSLLFSHGSNISSSSCLDFLLLMNGVVMGYDKSICSK